MGIDRSLAFSRMQKSLAAWRRVSHHVAQTAEARREVGPHDRNACPVCRQGVQGRCAFVDAVIVSEVDLEILADGFDLMSAFWCEIEDMTEREERTKRSEAPTNPDRGTLGELEPSTSRLAKALAKTRG